MAKVKAITAKHFWTLVWDTDGRPVPPMDCNPGSNDQGMLVYRTRKAATSAAEYQTEQYGDGAVALVVLLARTE